MTSSALRTLSTKSPPPRFTYISARSIPQPRFQAILPPATGVHCPDLFKFKRFV
ncbi:hypothetical protein JVU11DRAFT_7698 [Chiua virens]|nr:hypothetical protein JVU11DRAFT_12669 [Chiua virens]KAG9311499.1 hypothetical protein JVU11DRAFT_7698 [Chiua virens]